MNITSLKDKNGVSHTDKQEIAELLNLFFVNQPRDLLDSSSPTVDFLNSHQICSSKAVLVIPHINSS